jgi:hypothetical protein
MLPIDIVERPIVAVESVNGPGTATESLCAEISTLNSFLEFVFHRHSIAGECYKRFAKITIPSKPRALLEAMAKRKSDASKDLACRCGAIKKRNGFDPSRESLALFMLDVHLNPVCSLDEAYIFAFKKEQDEIEVLDEVLSRQLDFAVKQFVMAEQKRLADDIRELESDYVELVADA